MTFDDIEESTAISAETIRQFFHIFIKYGSTSLFKKYVIIPLTYNDAKTHISEMSKAGFPWCFGGTDATHIAMESCAYGIRQSHKGYKLPHPART